MHTLYGKKGSGSATIEAALTLCGAPFRQVETASWERMPRSSPARGQPIGQIDAGVPDGSAMSESAAILIHLGETHRDSGLLPADASVRAQVLRGLVYIAANCYAAISVIDFPERWCADADDDDAVKQRIRAGTRARLEERFGQ
jgi:GST-like protein